MTQSRSISPLGEAALRYAELGYAVFPLVPGGKTPITEHGHKDATVDPERIEAWWAKTPQAHIGIAAAGIVVIDRDGVENPWLQAEPERQAELARGPLVITWSGGVHHYFARPPGVTFGCSQSELAPKVDVRTDGGYVVVPPSSVNGVEYRFAPNQELDVSIDRLPALPDWLRERLEGGSGEGGRTPLTSTGGNRIPEGVRNGTLARLGGAMRRYGFNEAEIGAALRVVAANRCDPPMSESEADRVARSIAAYPPDQISVALAEDHYSQDRASSVTGPIALKDFLRTYDKLRLPIVQGLLRRGETANIIAGAKSRKSWLLNDLVVSVASGSLWLNTFPTTQGRVLIIDNELHPETIADRFPRVAAARGIPLQSIEANIQIWPLRGQLKDLVEFEPDLVSLGPGRFDLIIIDAFYRVLPSGTDENDNGAIAALYNVLDRTADRLGCAFILVHHTSKGGQAGKTVTDVGAGAGSQSRAADTHLILRPHKEDGAVVLDGVVRSWAPIEPMALRWTFPVWNPAPDLDPTQLRKDRPGKASETAVDLVEFINNYITPEPTPRAEVIRRAVEDGVSGRQAKALLSQASKSPSVKVIPNRGKQPAMYSQSTDGDGEGTGEEAEP